LSEGGSRGPSAWLVYGLLVLMVAFWSFNFIVARVALQEFPPLLAASLRAVFAGLTLLPLYLWKGRSLDKQPWSAKDLPVLLVLGVVGVTFNQVLFLLGYNRTSTTHAAIITGLLPLQVLTISALARIEEITRPRVMGMLVALVGVAVLQLARGGGGHPPTLLGDALVFLSGTTFACFAVVGKRLTAKHGGLTVNTFAFLGGGAVLLPVIAWQLRTFDLATVSLTGWASVLYMAIFPSAVAYVIFYYALTHLPASRVSAFGYLQPVMATILAVALMGDQITGTLLAGGSLVLTGVILTERS
jgi:drug/metabolite transporter (DMT)-like permease